MSREIKFRAWDTKDNQMITVETLHVKTGCVGKENDEWDWYKRDRILMQYTELKDRNGVEIYEGDIIKFGHGSIRRIEYDRGSFTMFEGESRRSPISDYISDSKVEVIGNIYENPELLEEN